MAWCCDRSLYRRVMTLNNKTCPAKGSLMAVNVQMSKCATT